MAGLFGSITIKGNRLTEFASQTATVGIVMPFGYGKYPCEGNVIFAPMPPKEHVKKKKQGKGGVKTEEYSYTLSYSVAFGEGPIFGFWIIKRNGKIVYTQDPNATVEDLAYAAKWAQKATFYYGTETQLPDSTIESYKGVGQVSAFRGVVHIVVEDDDVTDTGGAVPTYEAILIASAPDIYVTSTPYPIYSIESITPVTSTKRGAFFPGVEETQQSITPLNSELREVLIQLYTELENTKQTVAPLSGELREILVRLYADTDETKQSIAPLSGSIAITLVRYENGIPEPMKQSIAPIGGTLT